MKTFLKVHLLLSLLFSAVYAQQPSQTDVLERQFTLQAVEWMNAYNSGDARNLIPLYTEDAKYISGHVNGLQLDGRQDVIANFQNGINGGGRIDSIEILTINLSCDLATLLCRYQATNSGVTVEGRNLLVMKKTNGSWLIIMHITVV